MKKVTFYYVRHGQTLFNLQGRMQGWCDSPLTEKGIAEAVKARDDLKEIRLDRIYSSTSERCVDTVNIINEGRNIPVYYLKGLKEIYFGRQEGILIADHYEDIDNRRMNTRDWSDQGGENLEMFSRRIRETLEQIYDECEDGMNVLIVSHGAIFLQMVEFLFKLNRKEFIELVITDDPERHPIPNGFAAIFHREGDEYEMDCFIGRDEKILAKLKADRL